MKDPRRLPPGVIAQLQETVRACGAITELNATVIDLERTPHAWTAQADALEALGR